MKLSLKSYIHGITIGLVIIAGTLLSRLSVTNEYSYRALAEESFKIGGTGYQCLGAVTNRWKTNTENTATLPDGYTLETVVVKSGQGCLLVYPVDLEDDVRSCYSVSVDGQTVTVTQVPGANSSSCQEISHLEGSYIGPRPSDDPCDCEASPSASSSASPSATASASPSTEPSTEPSEAPASSPTPAPSSGGGNGGGSSDNNNNSTTSNNESQGEILGATLAATGVVEDVIMNTLGSLGGLMTVAGSVLYGKKKRS